MKMLVLSYEYLYNFARTPSAEEEENELIPNPSQFQNSA
jgi:hypothetical protein